MSLRDLISIEESGNYTVVPAVLIWYDDSKGTINSAAVQPAMATARRLAKTPEGGRDDMNKVLTNVMIPLAEAVSSRWLDKPCHSEKLSKGMKAVLSMRDVSSTAGCQG